MSFHPNKNKSIFTYISVKWQFAENDSLENTSIWCFEMVSTFTESIGGKREFRKNLSVRSEVHLISQVLLCFLKLFLLKHKRKLSCGCDLTSEQVSQGVCRVSIPWMSSGGALGTLLHLALLGMQSTLSSRGSRCMFCFSPAFCPVNVEIWPWKVSPCTGENVPQAPMNR